MIYNLANVLYIKSNIEFPQFLCLKETKNHNPDIQVEVKSELETPKNSIDVGYYKGNKGWVMLDRKIGRFKFRLLLEDLEGQTKIKIEKKFAMLFKLQIGRLSNLYTVLDAVVGLKLLMKGYCLLHASCLDINGKGHLFIGFSDSGKTYTVMKHLKKGKYVSDDVVIVNSSGKILGIQSPICKTRIPILPMYFRSLVTSNPLLRGKVADFTYARKLFFLDNSTIRKIDKEEALRRMLCVNHENFYYYSEPLIHAYEYFNPDFSLHTLMRIEEAILRRFVEKCECWRGKADECV